MPGFKPVDPKQSFPALEEAVLERWRERRVFERSMERRAEAPVWSFYEGPPTANGRPGSHHVLSRVFKDIYPRYRSMTGYRVPRKGGWDCHGLPVELEVEKQLGISSKPEIEEYGIAEFNARCRESVFAYVEEWNRLTERIGFWLDLDDAYFTLDDDYIESVWWSLRRLWDEGLLYQGHRVSPYCPRCGTALSSHEVALGYRDVEDPSIYVALPLRPRRDGGGGGGGEQDGEAPADAPAAGEHTAPVRAGDRLLIWTTTPWTLPGNYAVAAGSAVTYVRARIGADESARLAGAPEGDPGTGSSADDAEGDPGTEPRAATAPGPGAVVILAEELVERVLGEGAEILDRFPGSGLAGLRYGSPIFALDDREPGDSPVILADFVTTDDGTGLVHLAPAYGEDDYEAIRAAGLFDPAAGEQSLYNPVDLSGNFEARVRGFEGRFVKDPETSEALIADLDRRGLLLRAETYTHAYPHCWRCSTPLLYYAKSSWYIATSRIRDRLVANNEQIEWKPEHIKHGRFGKWLENNVDWALSRDRYWGTPLPIWECTATGCSDRFCAGSIEDLRERARGEVPADLHRPYIDEVKLNCERCGGEMRRVESVIDTWYDSGAMPFAQFHYPFENGERFERRFPADFICEAIDQTRGWFYTLLAESSMLFDSPSYRTCVCLGLLLDGDGQKMSKSKGNVVEPWEVIETHGADAFRWYLFTVQQPWTGYRFSVEGVGESLRQFLLTLWNTYSFWVMYANAEGLAPADLEGTPEASDPLDRWALSRLQSTVGVVRERMEDFDCTTGGRAIAEYVEALSNWYVRLSRRRFWEGDAAAFATLRHCLLEVAALLAPFTPFLADEIHHNLAHGESSAEGESAAGPGAGDVAGEDAAGAAAGDAADAPGDEPLAGNGAPRADSVHLRDYPEPLEALADPALESEMAAVRQTVELGRAARAQAKAKVRQPLRRAVIVATDAERQGISRHEELVRRELNVKELEFVAEERELVRYSVKPNYRTLGPRFGKDMPRVATAVQALDAAHVASAREQGGEVGIALDGQDHTLGAEDLELAMEPLEGYQVEIESGHAVALALELDEELRREGLAREIVHAVQNARKAAGLEITDRIALSLGGDRELLEAAGSHRDYVAGETLATSLTIGDAATTDPVGETASSSTIGDTTPSSTVGDTTVAATESSVEIEKRPLTISLAPVGSASA